jgi:hypothetical protein
LPMQIIIATALQIFAPQHHPCTRAAALAVQMPAHCLQVTAQSTADDLASLLCSLLCYTLTSLLCTSCSFLQHAAQRHSRAILPVRHAFAKRLRARVPLRHRAPFATYMARASRPWAPSTRRSLDDHDRQRLRHLPRHLRADHLPRLDFGARPKHICIVLCRAFRASSDPLRPARPQTARDTSNLLLVAHNVSHRVRHRPGRLKSPTEAPPRRGACRRLHASGLPNIYGLRPAICRPRPFATI